MSSYKYYLITFGISALVMFTITVIVFMLVLPKQSNISNGVIQGYKSIPKSEYTFEATKAISSVPLKKQYSISSEDISNFKYNNQYETGNTDPFEEKKSDTSSSTTKTDTDKNQEAVDKTTNSNGGVANPQSTSK